MAEAAGHQGYRSFKQRRPLCQYYIYFMLIDFYYYNLLLYLPVLSIFSLLLIKSSFSISDILDYLILFHYTIQSFLIHFSVDYVTVVLYIYHNS